MNLTKSIDQRVTVRLWTKADTTVPATGATGLTWSYSLSGGAMTAFTPVGAVTELSNGRYAVTIPAAVPALNGDLTIVGENATVYGDRDFVVGPLDDAAANQEAILSAVVDETAEIDAAILAQAVTLAQLLARTPAASASGSSMPTPPQLLTIHRGDDYNNASQPRLAWNLPTTHDMTGGTATLELTDAAGDPVAITHAGYLSTEDDANWLVEIELLNAATAALEANYVLENETQYLTDNSNLTRLNVYRFTPTLTFRVLAEDLAGNVVSVAWGLLVIPAA